MTSLSSSEARRTPDLIFWACALLTVVAAIFGGASRENVFRLMTVELAAVPVMALALRGVPWRDMNGVCLAALAIVLVVVALPAAQLVPLPPGVWTRLPTGPPRAQALALAGLPRGWRPLTIAPKETYAACLALIPPVAAFLASMRLDPAARRRCVLLFLACTALGLVLGLAQMASPDADWPYPYETTNRGFLVGWFANRNHEAGALLVALPFVAAILGRRTREEDRFLRLALSLFGLAAIVALAAIRSRAGVALAPFVLVAAVAIFRATRQGARRTLVIAIAAAATLGVAVFAELTPLVDRFKSVTGPEVRFDAWPVVERALWAHLPWGSGIGSFDRVYRSVEPLALVGPQFFNHAHNEYLEIGLEAGLPGLLAAGTFLVWFAIAGAKAWRSGDNLARAAVVAVGTLLLQSAVDYPLRTESLAVLFAFCCGMIASRAPRSERERYVVTGSRS